MWTQTPARLCEFSVLVLGLWQLYFTLVVRVEASFDTLFTYSFVPLVLALILAVLPNRRFLSPEAEASPQPYEDPQWAPVLLGAALLGVVLWYRFSVPYAVPWVLGAASLALTARRAPVPAPVDSSASRADALWIGLAAVVAVLATMWIHRPSNDDAYYLNQIWKNIQHADLALLSFDGMHGDLTAPVQQPAHRAQGYEALISVLVRLTGVDARDLYFIVLPSIAAAGVPLAAWLVVRQWLGRPVARVSMFVLSVLLVAWGGNLLSVGNFGYARLFQGKSVLAVVMLPIVVAIAYRFANAPSTRLFILLVLSQVASAGLTSTGLLVAPVCAGLVVLTSMRPDRRSAIIAGLGLVSSVPNLIMTLLVKLDVDAMGDRGGTGPVNTLADYLDNSWRVPMTMAVLLVMPWVVRRAAPKVAPWLNRYVFVLFVLLLNQSIVRWIASYAGNLYTIRMYWAAPIAILVAATLALGVVAAKEKARIPVAIGTVLFLVLFWFAGVKTFDAENQASLRFNEWKVLPEEYAVAERLVEGAEPDSLVLAPPLIAGRVTTFPNSPAVVSIRWDYLIHLRRHWNQQEYVSRRALMRLALGIQVRKRMDWVISKLDKWCVDRLALPMGVADRHGLGLRNSLRANGYSHEIIGTYEVWIRDRATCKTVKGPAGVRKDKPAADEEI